MLEIYPVISTTLAVLAGTLILKSGFLALPDVGSRYSSLDGLRGFLALAVFFHHYLITYYWKQTDTWTNPPNELFENFGRVGVALFFMITGFLFVGKLLDDDRPNWFLIFKSRLFRILPLYLVALVIISIVVFTSQHTANTQFSSELPNDYLRWLLFIGGPINDFPDTSKVIAGVHWTLKYEWLFYILLPIIFMVLKSGIPMVVGLGVLTIFLNIYPVDILGLINTVHFVFFLCGGLVAKSVRTQQTWNEIASSTASSLIAMALLLLALLHATPLSISHVLILCLFFAIIAHGNTVFGLLTLPSVRAIGEISYSIYLLHGVILYLAFTNIFPDFAKDGSLPTYMVAMPICTLAVVIFSVFSFKWIEEPMIKIGKHKPRQIKLASPPGRDQVARFGSCFQENQAAQSAKPRET